MRSPHFMILIIGAMHLSSCVTSSVEMKSRANEIDPYEESWGVMYVDFVKRENDIFREELYPVFTVILTSIDLHQERFWGNFFETVEEHGKAEAVDSLSRLVEESGASMILLTKGGRKLLTNHELFSIIEGAERTDLWKLSSPEEIRNPESLRRIRS